MTSTADYSEVCNFLVFEAVNENWISVLKSARRTYSSMALLTSLIQCNDKGETPLVVAMKKKNVSIIEELMTWITENDVYKEEECEPILIMLIDQLAYHIPIVKLLDYLITDLLKILQNITNSDWLDFIAQVFIQSTYLTRQDKIIALDLIGASLILTSIYNKGIFALKYWRIAMTLRYLPAYGEPLLPKLSALCVPSVSSSVVFGSVVEVMTLEELDLLQGDFERNYLSLDAGDARFLCGKRMQIQALLVIRRISSQANLGHPHWLHLESLRSFCLYMIYIQLNLGNSDSTKIAINTCLLIFEQCNGFDPKMLCNRFVFVFMESLFILSDYFVEMIEKPDSPGKEDLSYANLLTVTKFLTAIQCDHFSVYEDRVFYMELLYRYLFVLESISPQLTNQEQQNLEKYYHNYIRDSTERTSTVLHVAVGRNIFSVSAVDYEMLKIINLILKLGADPNAMDEFGRTPLHILAGMKESQVDEYLHIYQALVDAGSHLDIAADNGETVLSVLKKTLRLYQFLAIPVHPYFESLINSVFLLTCYAARVIRRHGIPFDEDRLPLPLQAFVKRHSTREFAD